MRTKFFFFCLILVLGWLVLGRLTRNNHIPGHPQGTAETRLAPGSPGPVAIQTIVSPSKDGFHWSQIETNDLREYVARLRAAACPENTIQDILIGLISRRYESRLADLRREARAPFWQALERRTPSSDQESAKREAALRDVRHERDALVRDLLGIDLNDYLAGRAEKPDRVTDLLDAVGEQVRPEARRILERYNELERSVAARVGGTLGLPEQVELEQLYRRKVEELRGIMSSADLEEFELRTSPLAHRLRTADLVGFSPTEEEFRAIYRLRKTWENEGTAAQSSSFEPRSQDADAQLRQVLGDNRFADYQRSQDMTYRQLVEFTGHYGLVAEAAAQVHDVREAVVQQVDRLDADPRLQGATRERVLGQIQAEAASAVRESLGEEVYKRYLDTHYGRWLALIPTWTNGIVLRN